MEYHQLVVGKRKIKPLRRVSSEPPLRDLDHGYLVKSAQEILSRNASFWWEVCGKFVSFSFNDATIAGLLIDIIHWLLDIKLFVNFVFDF